MYIALCFISGVHIISIGLGDGADETLVDLIGTGGSGIVVKTPDDEVNVIIITISGTLTGKASLNYNIKILI